MKIYVASHKEAEIPSDPIYNMIVAGAADKEWLKSHYTGDDEGENISAKNDSYCELSVLYWIWKNAQEDIVGLVHYRRYFAKIKSLFRIRSNYFVINKKHDFRYVNSKDIMKELESYDILVKKSKRFRKTVRDVELVYINSNCYQKMVDVIAESYPAYYPAFENLVNSHQYLNCNMFVGKKEVVDSYCEWLFDVLEKIDQKRIKDCGERYHNRELGYLGEILFGVWLNANHISYKPVDVVQIGVDLKGAYKTNKSIGECNVLSIGELPLYIKYYFKRVKSVLSRDTK